MSLDEIIAELELDAKRYREMGGYVSSDYISKVLLIYAEALRLVAEEKA